MSTTILYSEVQTTRSIDEVVEAAKQAFKSLGGTISSRKNGFRIEEGKTGVKFGFAAQMKAKVTISEQEIGFYEVECKLEQGFSAAAVFCLIGGFFAFWFVWAVPALYAFNDSEAVYQRTLDRIQSRANRKRSMPSATEKGSSTSSPGLLVADSHVDLKVGTGTASVA